MSKTYSLPQIWDLNAQALNDSVGEGLVEGVPVSGDAWQRARARALRAGFAWEHPGALARLHRGLISTTGRDEAGELAARDEYRARMSSHVSTVLAGGDLSTLEPTC